MLRVWFGTAKDDVLNPDSYFDHSFVPEWMDDPLVREMVLDVDKSEVQSRYCIMSPVFGQIPPQMLSGGVKGLILWLKLDDFYPNMIIFGRNCEKWIKKIAEIRDISGTMSGLDLYFESCGGIDGICENNGKAFHTAEEWTQLMSDWVYQMQER